MSAAPDTFTPPRVVRINPLRSGPVAGFDQGQLRHGVSSVLTIAGQGPLDARGRLMHHDDPAAQLALALANVEGVLAAAGLGLPHLAQLRIYVTDMAAALDVYDTVVEHLAAADASPPTTLVQVAGLAIPGMTVEIEGVALA